MRKFLLGVVAVGMMAGAVHAQNGAQALPPMAADASPSFDVVTIKPADPNHRGGGFTWKGRHVMTINTSVNELVSFAYGVRASQVLGGPAWSSSDHFDIDGVANVDGKPSQKQMEEMIQKLLADRFKLTFHHEDKELPAFAVVVGKNGPKLTKTVAKPEDHDQFMFQRSGNLTAVKISMHDFADGMGGMMDRPFVDQTGLTDKYDFTLKWTPDNPPPVGKNGNPVAPPPEDPNGAPGLFTAIQEQLGLKLEPTKAKVDVIAIDKVERPSEN